MRKYETVFISDPDLQEQTRLNLFDKIRNIIAKENGILLDFDEWGNKKLAYEIKKKLRGHYACVTYGGTGDLINELERNFRLSDDVLKFMTLQLSDDVTVQQLEIEAQKAQDQSEEADKKDKEPADKEIAGDEVVEEKASAEDEKVEKTEKETE
ncbi:MAG: 30S ribosomal protein S6 [Deltaproteobacteria bacterium]|nr:30S ribosomal protein S6 [Deltaproteobacteria bacterium]